MVQGAKTISFSVSPKQQVVSNLKNIGLLSFFQIIPNAYEVKRGKPYPDIYLAALKDIGLSARECLAIEDTQYGVESAKAAGLICFAIPGEFSKKQNFSKADNVFKNLKELMNFCKQKC
jgi:beta-phosphoglucomutase-like phosphatase (HAD superfamily)